MIHWQKSTVPPQLQAGELHIWKIELDYDSGHWQPLMALLSNDEQIKADRFRFEKLRLRYIAGRVALRKLLGGYIGCAPEALIFVYNDYGKPSLQKVDSGLCFNVTHSGETMLAAFALNSKIGIDIEAIQQNIDCMDICQRWFSVQESNALRDLPEEERIGAFFRVWTRKEAYIKARGIGLSYPLNRFSVSLDETAPALLEHQDCSQEMKLWQIYNIEVSSAYSAAVVLEAARWEIHHYYFQLLRK